MISIREETSHDLCAIREVTLAAFAASEFGHNGEADLIDALRTSDSDHLSLVAHSDHDVVGHILFTSVTVRTPQQQYLGMGLAPMSVSPQHQRNGVGSLLVTEGLDRLFGDGCQFVVVLGHPAYYPRFGFQSASRFGILHGFSEVPQDLFFICNNPRFTMTHIIGGRAYYHPVFGPQHTST